MKELGSDYGSVLIGQQEELFETAAERLLTEASKRSMATVGVPGGATPLLWFKWMLDREALDARALDRICWFTSDERYVPVTSQDSNFGNAARVFLDPLKVPETRRMPWPVNVDPYSASIVFNRRWNERFGEHRCFDLCVLGLGQDGHMASIFPKSPIVGLGTNDNFTSVDVPGHGWRLTITDQGLRRCGQILILVVGDNKAAQLRDVMDSPFDPSSQPAHLLREIADKVTWLVDEKAAQALKAGA